MSLLTPVPWPGPRRIWGTVKFGLYQVIAKSGARYWVEDVYADLRSGASFLYLVQSRGFMVLQQQKDVDGTNLHVFACWCPGAEEISDELWAALDQLARDCGCVRVTAAGRKGWGRAGFRETGRNFEREV